MPAPCQAYVSPLHSLCMDRAVYMQALCLALTCILLKRGGSYAQTE
mgnify:CR=1 FL=1